MVRLSFPGTFDDAYEFFKSTLKRQGWTKGDWASGEDITGRYGRVFFNRYGYRGDAVVIACADADVEILIEYRRKSRS